MQLVLVDSYDSFTHNLVQGFEVLGAEVSVVRGDEVSVGDLRQMSADLLVFGPGPGRPEQAGCIVDAVRTLAGEIPILGVCLGHQAIGLAFGGAVVRHTVVHGHATEIHHDSDGIFAGIPPGANMTRYHSLVVDPTTLPHCLHISAWSEDGAIMALRHRHLPLWGVQFHPESVLSGSAGMALMRNFVGHARLGAAVAARGIRPAVRVPA